MPAWIVSLYSEFILTAVILIYSEPHLHILRRFLGLSFGPIHVVVHWARSLVLQNSNRHIQFQLVVCREIGEAVSNPPTPMMAQRWQVATTLKHMSSENQNQCFAQTPSTLPAPDPSSTKETFMRLKQTWTTNKSSRTSLLCSTSQYVSLKYIPVGQDCSNGFLILVLKIKCLAGSAFCRGTFHFPPSHLQTPVAQNMLQNQWHTPQANRTQKIRPC